MERSLSKRANNPRVFNETISLAAWRTTYDAKNGEADLHVDVGFSEGRIGGAELPVRFRLRMRKAEVHVILDTGSILEIPPASVRRSPLPTGVHQKTLERASEVEGGAGIAISSSTIDANLSAKGKAAIKVTENFTQTHTVSPMKVRHRNTDTGYVFVVEPGMGVGELDGQPWDPLERLLTLRDRKHERPQGEAPEPRIEIRCRREDLIIEDIKLLGQDANISRIFSRNKVVAAEQYIKNELIKAGLECGDISNPYEQIIVSDASPYVY